MRMLNYLSSLVIAGSFLVFTTELVYADKHSEARSDCESFGFTPGTDSFANCMLQLTLQKNEHRAPDRDTLIKRYRELSRQRQGDARYPVCSAANMQAELDIETGKWVGDDCGMAPD